MTLDICTGLLGNDLSALAERMDAANATHKSARTVGTVWARGDAVKIDDHGASR